MSKIKICLDAGHVGSKYNQSPVVKTYYESAMVWSLHLKLKAALEARGLSRSSTTAVTIDDRYGVYAPGRGVQGVRRVPEPALQCVRDGERGLPRRLQGLRQPERRGHHRPEDRQEDRGADGHEAGGPDGDAEEQLRGRILRRPAWGPGGGDAAVPAH